MSSTKDISVVTPRVHAIAQVIFAHELLGVGVHNEGSYLEPSKPMKQHRDDPVSMVWLSEGGSPGYFSQVEIDGVIYEVDSFFYGIYYWFLMLCHRKVTLLL